MNDRCIAECPKQFCFNYLIAGDKIIRGRHANFEQAKANFEVVLLDQCGWWLTSEPCCRQSRNDLDKDFYEPNEPALKKARLSVNQFTQVRTEVAEADETDKDGNRSTMGNQENR